MSKYEICCNNYDSFLDEPSKADQYAMMVMNTRPDVRAIKVIKKIVTDPQVGVGIKIGNTPFIIGGRYGRKEEKIVEYTFYKY